MYNMVGEHVGIGTDYYVVVNCGQTSTWLKFEEEDKLSIVYKRLVRFLSTDQYEATSTNIIISYETGCRSYHPHINIVMDWDGMDAKADELYYQISLLLGDDEKKVRDIKIRQVYNERGIMDYITKEKLTCVGDKYLDPKLEVDADDELEIEEGKRKKDGFSLNDMKAIIEKEFNDGVIMNKESMAKFFYEKGMCIPYTNVESACCQFLKYLVGMRDMMENNKRMNALPNDSAMYWFEFVSVQSDWLKLFKRFAMLFDRPRDPCLDNQTALVLWGATGTGKTWMTSWRVFVRLKRRV